MRGRSSSPDDHSEALKGNQKTTLEILLAAFPGSARIRNRRGKLPLELAIESECTWKDGGIACLLQAYPEAAGLRNPNSNKLPLQLLLERDTHCDDGVEALLQAHPAAVNAVTQISARTKLPLFILAKQEGCSLSAIYSIVRAGPQVALTRFQPGSDRRIATKKRMRMVMESSGMMPMMMKDRKKKCGGSRKKKRQRR